LSLHLGAGAFQWDEVDRTGSSPACMRVLPSLPLRGLALLSGWDHAIPPSAKQAPGSLLGLLAPLWTDRAQPLCATILEPMGPICLVPLSSPTGPGLFVWPRPLAQTPGPDSRNLQDCTWHPCVISQIRHFGWFSKGWPHQGINRATPRDK